MFDIRFFVYGLFLFIVIVENFVGRYIVIMFYYGGVGGDDVWGVRGVFISVYVWFRSLFSRNIVG